MYLDCCSSWHLLIFDSMKNVNFHQFQGVGGARYLASRDSSLPRTLSVVWDPRIRAQGFTICWIYESKNEQFYFFLFSAVTHECPALSCTPRHFPFLYYFCYWQYTFSVPTLCHFPVWRIVFLIFVWLKWYLSFRARPKAQSFLTCILCGFYIPLCFFFYEFLTIKVWVYRWSVAGSSWVCPREDSTWNSSGWVLVSKHETDAGKQKWFSENESTRLRGTRGQTQWRVLGRKYWPWVFIAPGGRFGNVPL